MTEPIEFYRVNPREAYRLIYSDYSKGPYRKYLAYNAKGDYWTAVDNSTGDAWTEDFASEGVAIRWLIGEIEMEEAHDRDRLINGLMELTWERKIGKYSDR